MTMTTFILLTRISPEAVQSPRALEILERKAMQAVRRECPQVEWLQSFAILGPCDYLDVFRAPDVETATRVAALIRIAGRAHTEVWVATEWAKFKEIIRTLPEVTSLLIPA